MKNFKRFLIIFAVFLLISSVLSCSAYASKTFDYSDYNSLPENDKIMACLPEDYYYEPFGAGFGYCDEDGDILDFAIDENKFAPEGITSLTKEQVQEIFIHYYIYCGELEREFEIETNFISTKKVKKNGLYTYELKGSYNYGDDFYNYNFCAYVFATIEDIFVITYEASEDGIANMADISNVMATLAINGTFFEGDNPSILHNFENSPSYNEVLESMRENDILESGPIFEDGVLGIAAVIAIVMTVVPTLIVIFIAIVLIRKYNKVKKTLRQCELTYGSISQYNAYNQNYGGYGYNQPINQPYQPPVNPVYQQNPVNQNAPQTPSYVTNAVNNLEGQQPQQPVQTPETQVVENNENAGE